MYDNLDLILPLDKCPGIDFLHEIPQFLSTVTNQGKSKYGYYFKGYLDNLKITVNEKNVSIYKSSICKYWHGNNFQTMTRQQTQQAIQKISDSLHLPFNLATVKRIDFAENFSMQHPEKVYYPYLGESKFYERLPQINGVYYNLKTKQRQLIFYGKIYEQKQKRQPIPENLKDQSLLRYELRFLKKLPQQLNRAKITASLLYDEKFYNNLVQRYKDEYFSIKKVNSELSYLPPTGSKKEFLENLAAIAISDIGQPQILKLLDQWFSLGSITKKQKYELKNFVKNSLNPINSDAKINLIAELDNKILLVA